MTDTIHPMAAHHQPVFITYPGTTDWLLVAMGVFLVLLILVLGTLYFRLHALPEHMSHGRNNKTQFEIVAVLALLALFTHNNLFWVAALLLAMVPIPDITTPLNSIVRELRRIAEGKQRTHLPPSATDDDPELGGTQTLPAAPVTGG